MHCSDSETDTASEGPMAGCNTQAKCSAKKRKLVATEERDSDIQVLKVEPGFNQRQVEIIKVERARKVSPDVEIVKVIPGTSCSEAPTDAPQHCKVLGRIGRFAVGEFEHNNKIKLM